MTCCVRRTIRYLFHLIVGSSMYSVFSSTALLRKCRWINLISTGSILFFFAIWDSLMSKSLCGSLLWVHCSKCNWVYFSLQQGHSSSASLVKLSPLHGSRWCISLEAKIWCAVGRDSNVFLSGSHHMRFSVFVFHAFLVKICCSMFGVPHVWIIVL